MLFSPSDFFNLFFTELERRTIPYVVLHSYETLPERIVSDVDYAVLTGDLEKLADIQRALAEGVSARLAHTIEAHIYALYTVVIDRGDLARFIQLDACGHYVEKGSFLIRGEMLLEGRKKLNGFYVPAAEAEFCYLLAKALAKNTPLEPRLPRLRHLWESEPGKCGERFRALTGNEVPLREWFSRQPAEWENLREPMMRKNRFGWQDRARESLRAIKRIAQPRGLHLAFAGLDQEKRFRLESAAGPLITGPFFRRQLVRDAGAARDGLADYVGKILPAKVRNELIISSESSGSSGQPALTAPVDLRFLVDADWETMHARQPALTAGEFRAQQQALHRLAMRPRHVLIPATLSIEQSIQLVGREVIEYLSQREGD